MTVIETRVCEWLRIGAITIFPFVFIAPGRKVLIPHEAEHYHQQESWYAVAWIPGLLTSWFIFNGICLQTLHSRSLVRSRLGIMQHSFEDAFLSCCLPTCSLGQQHIELERRGIDPGLACMQSSMAGGRNRGPQVHQMQ